MKIILNFKLNKIKNKVVKYLSKERLIAISLLSRIISLVLVMTFIPVVNTYADNEPVKDEVSQTNIKLDTRTANLIQIIDESPKITEGESNYNKRIREERAKKTASISSSDSRVVISRENRSYDTDVPLSQKRELAKSAAKEYGIDWKILEAVWQVESGKKWATSVKSYAGAQGPMQFMRGTWNKYAVDGNGDGNKDINDAQDAVYAGANLLAQAGAATGDVDKALFSYNHAQWYVNKVKAVAASINE